MNKFNITAKTNFYYSNGSGFFVCRKLKIVILKCYLGRDGYIVENSGGMTHTRRPQSAGYQSSRFMSFNMQKRAPYQASAKVIHYTSDGSGRDNYIM